jgi:hypothetical protein
MRAWLLALVLLGGGALVWGALSQKAPPEDAAPVRPRAPEAPAPVPEDLGAWATLVVTVRAVDGSLPPGAQAGYVRDGRPTLLQVDEAGRRTFANLPPGPIEILARAPGYEEARETRPLVGRLTTSVTMRLKPERRE